MTTRNDVLNILKSANCCLAKKVAVYDRKIFAGQVCEDKLEAIGDSFNLIDSIIDFVPEGDTIGGVQACANINILGGTIIYINITIGSSVYPTLNTSATTPTNIAIAMAAFINSFYPQSFPYTSSSNGAALTVCGTNYNNSNGTSITISENISGTGVHIIPGTMSGGTLQVLQGKNCLTNNEANIILEKLKCLCDCSKN